MQIKNLPQFIMSLKQTKILLYIVVGLFVQTSFAGTDNNPVGARAAGMANSAVVLKDIWSVNHNQAGVAYLTKPTVGLYFENRFLIQELSLASLAVAYPIANGVMSLNLTHWGFSNFNTTKIGFAFSKKFGEKISGGLQLDYFNTFLSAEYGNRGAVVAEVGILAEPIDNLLIGAHVYNPTRAKIASYNDERLPTILNIGVGYHFSKNILLSIETEKNLIEPIIFKSGIEYMYLDKFFLRAGISTNPIFNTFGFGYIFKTVKVDLAFSRHQVLGLIPHFSVNYSF